MKAAEMKLEQPDDRRDGRRRRARDRLLDAAAQPEARRSERSSARRSTQVEASLAQHQAEVAAAEEARKQFPVDYQQLVVLGKAVPATTKPPRCWSS